MNTKEAVANRILALCKEKKIALNSLANSAGITPSTLYSLLGNDRKNPGIVTIKKLCDGFGISLCEFFNCEMFAEVEQEMR